VAVIQAIHSGHPGNSFWSFRSFIPFIQAIHSGRSEPFPYDFSVVPAFSVLPAIWSYTGFPVVPAFHFIPVTPS
jgi:hypothetical protein